MFSINTKVFKIQKYFCLGSFVKSIDGLKTLGKNKFKRVFTVLLFTSNRAILKNYKKVSKWVIVILSKYYSTYILKKVATISRILRFKFCFL